MRKIDRLLLQIIGELGPESYVVPIRRELIGQTWWIPSHKTIYDHLERLEKQGYVESRIGESTAVRGNRPKRNFRLTKNGETLLRQLPQMSWLERFGAMLSKA